MHIYLFVHIQYVLAIVAEC